MQRYNINMPVKRDKRLNVCVSDEFYTALKLACELRNISITKYVLRLIYIELMKDEILDSDNKDQITKIFFI